MDRTILYPGAIPLAEDGLNVQRSAMKAIGYIAQATLGTGVVADGLACGPVSPASMTLEVGPGSMTSFGVVDGTPFSTLPADANPLVKMGIASGYTSLTFVAPGGAGMSMDYLIQGSFEELDGTPLVIPYYNAADSAQPYSGPGGGGASQATVRSQIVSIQLKAGSPAVTGSQVAPGADAGWVPLYVISVPAGATSLTDANIALATGAPFIGLKIPGLDAAVAALQAAVSALQASVTVVQTSGSSETTRAEGVEALLNTAIGAEVVRAEAAEANLNNEIDNEAQLRAAADNAEAQARAEGDASVSASIGPAVAAAIAAAISAEDGNPGYLKVGSTIFVWGTGTISNGSAEITFPISFPSACLNVRASEVDANGWINNGTLNPVSYAPAGQPGKSGCSIIGVTTLSSGTTQANNGGGFFYFAIGC